MTSSDISEQPQISRSRGKRKSYSLLILAAGIFLFGATAGALCLGLRPVTLRIAVGPAGSHAQKLIQALAQTFTRGLSPFRPSPITTPRTTDTFPRFTPPQHSLA